MKKQEQIEWMADNPFYTKRFADFVGRKCRSMTINAEETQSFGKNVIGYHFNLKNKGNSLFLLEVFDSNGPSRNYVESNLKTLGDLLSWALWNRDILLEISCVLQKEALNHVSYNL